MKYYKTVIYEKLGRYSWALTLKRYFYIHQEFILIYLYDGLDLLGPKFIWLGKTHFLGATTCRSIFASVRVRDRAVHLCRWGPPSNSPTCLCFERTDGHLISPHLLFAREILGAAGMITVRGRGGCTAKGKSWEKPSCLGQTLPRGRCGKGFRREMEGALTLTDWQEHSWMAPGQLIFKNK